MTGLSHVRRLATVGARLRLVLLAVVLTPAASLAVDDGGPVIVRPRNLATALGPSTIEVEVPERTGLDRLEIVVDGDVVATFAAPPWTTTWDFGDGSSGHRVEAIARYVDGRAVRRGIRTSPLRVDQVESVDLVNLYAIVRDASGGYVTDLGRDDFHIFEDGVPQKIERFTTEHKPLNVALVLDASLSMGRGNRLEKARHAALEFLDVLRPEDRGLVTIFNDTVRVAQEMTASKADLTRAIESATEEGGTALYDAVWRTAQKLQGFDGRRVLVLLSDGRDEAASGLEPGSLHTLGEALEQSLRSEVMVFSIGLGKRLDEECVFHLRPALAGRTGCPGESVEDVLREMADRTGGRAMLSTGPRQLRTAFQDVATALGNQYSLAYKPSNEKRTGEWREIRIVTPERRKLEVVTRSGYYAVPRDAAELSPTAAPASGDTASPGAGGERRAIR